MKGINDTPESHSESAFFEIASILWNLIPAIVGSRNKKTAVVQRPSYHRPCSKKTSCFYKLLISFLILTTHCVFCQQYSVRGSLDIKTKIAEADTGKVAQVFFIVEVNGSQYKIRTWVGSNEAVYHKYAFKEGVLLTLHHIPSGIHSNNPAVVQAEAVKPKYPGSAEEREIPANDGSRAQFVWFVYASKSYFAGLTNNFLVPLWSPEDPALRKQPFSMLAFFDLLPEPSLLPKDVDFVNDGVYRSYNPSTKSLDVIPLAAPYDKGYTNATYRVISTTNIHTIQVPSEFVFTLYSSPIGSPSPPFERIAMRGKAMQVTDSVSENLSKRVFEEVASVTDYRVAGTVARGGSSNEFKYAAYPITNGGWLNSNQLSSVRSQIEARVASRLRQQAKLEDNRKSRALIIAFLILTTSIPLLFFWRWHARRSS